MDWECTFVDVFTEVPYAGNQLAVFPDADGLDTPQMQKLAQEINYSETTFILKSSGASADFNVRIFTPRVEMPFAGHPLLGTAYCIMNILDVFPENRDSLKVETQSGIVPLEKRGDKIWMTQNQPRFFRKYTNKKEIAELVNLRPEDICDDHPVEEVATGICVLIVPVKDLDAIRRAVGHADNLVKFLKGKDTLLPYLFTLDTVNPAAGVHTRCFAPHLGITEDAATGSAAGPLTAYFLKYGVFGKSFEIQNEQGMEMGRPSHIFMHGAITDEKYIIRIGGNCSYVGRGRFVA